MSHTVETMNKTVETIGKKISRDQKLIEKLTHEIAQLKRLKFAKRREQMNPEQASLLDDLIDTDIAAIEAELQTIQIAPVATEKKPCRSSARARPGNYSRIAGCLPDLRKVRLLSEGCVNSSDDAVVSEIERLLP
jgi:hypothetical protein